MTERGYVWAVYHDDNGTAWSLRVDRDYADMGERGWVLVGDVFPPVFGRGWAPRRVLGYDELGHQQTAIVATTEADLWTGETTQFTILGTDELAHTCTVIGRMQERRRRPAGSP
jgi:hypothetical protein